MTNKEIFIETYNKNIHRPGAEKLLAWLEGYLRRGIGVAHNETGTYRPVKPRKVERYNILTLFIFNRTNDSFDQFIHK